MRLRKPEQLGVPLESLPSEVQELFADQASLYRERLRLPSDEPLRVVLPENPSPELRALLEGGEATMRLRKTCRHGLYDKHYDDDSTERLPFCPGGTPPTLDDLIAALDQLNVEGLVRVSYVGPDMPPIVIE